MWIGEREWIGIFSYLKLLGIGDRMSNLLEHPQSLKLHIFRMISNLLEISNFEDTSVHEALMIKPT